MLFSWNFTIVRKKQLILGQKSFHYTCIHQDVMPMDNGQSVLLIHNHCMECHTELHILDLSIDCGCAISLTLLHHFKLTNISANFLFWWDCNWTIFPFHEILNSNNKSNWIDEIIETLKLISFENSFVCYLLFMNHIHQRNCVHKMTTLWTTTTTTTAELMAKIHTKRILWQASSKQT